MNICFPSNSILSGVSHRGSLPLWNKKKRYFLGYRDFCVNTALLLRVSLVSSIAVSSYSNSPDEVIIEAIIHKGKVDLFDLLYDRYSDKVFRKCMSFAHDRDIASDMVQDILLKVFTSSLSSRAIAGSLLGSTPLHITIVSNITAATADIQR